MRKWLSSAASRSNEKSADSEKSEEASHLKKDDVVAQLPSPEGSCAFASGRGISDGGFWYRQLPVLISFLLMLVLVLLPTGYEGFINFQESDLVSAQVVDVDNSTIRETGLVKSGEQHADLIILAGHFKGQKAVGTNILTGSLAADKIFEAGDRAFVRVNYDGDEILTVSMIDYDRRSSELLLAGLFILLVVIFAGWTGVRAILSFGVTILALWKVLVPAYLNGQDPILIGMLMVLGLTVVVLSLVYGFDKRFLASTAGCFLGILVTAVLGYVFTGLFRLSGAVMQSSESLLYAGYQQLNLTRIFIASIFLGSAGSVMDLAADIASAVHEVTSKRPDLDWLETAKSGMNVGRAGIGTMTTTLLFAYSGGYMALLMVFMAQGTPTVNILNLKYVAAEIIHTVVGSFGLVTVAPFTALCAGLIMGQRRKAPSPKD